MLALIGSLLLGGARTAAAQPAHDELAPALVPIAQTAPALAPCNSSNVRLQVSKAGSTIVGAGGVFGCSSTPRATLTLQRHRWYGWQNLSSWSGGFVPNTWGHVRWNCGNAGTHTYRTIMVGRTVGGRPWFRESGHLRVTC